MPKINSIKYSKNLIFKSTLKVFLIITKFFDINITIIREK